MSDISDPSYFRVLGIIVYLAGTVTYALGPALQKLALKRQYEEKVRGDDLKTGLVEAGSNVWENSGSKDHAATAEEQRFAAETTAPASKTKTKEPKTWLWWVGITMYVSSGVLWAVALIFAPVSLLSPLLATAVLLNFVFTATLLKEKVKKRDGFAGLLLLASIIFVAISAPEEDALENLFPEHVVNATKNCAKAQSTMDNYGDLVKSGLFLGYTALLFATMGGIYALQQWIEKKHEARPLTPNESVLLPATYGLLAGMCGGATNPLISMIFQVISIATKTACASVPFKNAIIWLSLVVLIIVEVGQLFFINQGLKNHEAKFIITLEIIGNEITQVLAALMAFRSYDYFGSPVTFYKVLFSVGILLACAGCAIMATGVAEKSEKIDQLKRYSFADMPTPSPRNHGSSDTHERHGRDRSTSSASSSNYSLINAAKLIAYEAGSGSISRSGSFA